MPHFLEYNRAATRNPNAPYAVLPVPYERSVSFGRGTARAPSAILKASVQLELFDEELKVPLDLDVQTLPAIPCRTGTTRHVFRLIECAARKVLEAGRFLMTFGGEHSITMPLVAATQKIIANDLCVLHLDAHLDLRKKYKSSKFSHACVMRRILDELGVPIVSVGIRSLCREEYELVKTRRIPVIWAHDIAVAPKKAWMDDIVAQLGKNVYITVDVDCLDPAVIPGTGTPEPGGLMWRELTGLLRRVCAARRIIAADIVELAPVPGITTNEYIAARLAAKLMLYQKTARCKRPQP